MSSGCVTRRHRTSRSKIRNLRPRSFRAFGKQSGVLIHVVLRLFFASFSTSNACTVLHLVLALSAALTAAAQPPDSQTGASRVALAIVTDLKNHPLIDVSADDFVIQEGGTA